MANSGAELGADLYALWRAGRDNLPSVAAQYTAAVDSLARTESGQSNAFQRPARFGGGTYGPVHGPWTALRDELATLLNEMATSLELTGDALCLAATEYAKTDAVAAEEFLRLRAVLGEPAPSR